MRGTKKVRVACVGGGSGCEARAHRVWVQRVTGAGDASETLALSGRSAGADGELQVAPFAALGTAAAGTELEVEVEAWAEPPPLGVGSSAPGVGAAALLKFILRMCCCKWRIQSSCTDSGPWNCTSQNLRQARTHTHKHAQLTLRVC